jgi:hypothetical protein
LCKAAVWNVGRVLVDLSLVLNYNMEPREHKSSAGKSLEDGITTSAVMAST